MKKLIKLTVLACTVLALTACGNREGNDDDYMNNKTEPTKNVESVMEKIEADDELLEKQIEEFRKERDKDKYIKEEDGMIIGTQPNEEDYIKGFDEVRKVEPKLPDDLEEAYEEVERYLVEDKKVEQKTRILYYLPADPRVYKVYIDEDKGKLQGYDNENIIVMEYLDGDTWKFVYVAKENKEGQWKFVHDGINHKE
ncbi:MAG: hypothetical protein WAO56_08745 [Miniphocaeibacter sp.]|uniref:hypothetical protein n=1 Tax=Miniphocaeibacter sp. TaxID=3100973 RepID=UPI00183639D1|nr:hypothetical protein [Gallicola sp.]